jgi:hypothetical protein
VVKEVDYGLVLPWNDMVEEKYRIGGRNKKVKNGADYPY